MRKKNYYQLRDITGTRWIKFNALRPSLMPAEAACYAVYWNGRLVYIGQTTDLRNRFHLHNFRLGYANNIHTPWGHNCPDTDVFTVKARFSERLGDWAMREIRLIRRLRPEFNSHHKGRKVAA